MELELVPRISPSEKDFFLKHFGDKRSEVLAKLHLETLKKDEYCCQGCHISALNQEPEKMLALHLVEENEAEPLKSIFTSLCKWCHITQHIDRAILEGWVKVVNSSLTQKSLISVCRTSSVHTHIKDGTVKILKTTPEEYLDQLKKDTLPLHSRVKVIFTSKFE